jgi:16S rRNA (cytidine1402-2'-O)-methyltransferase
MLYLVATPIGNLDDISKRALETLKKCDIIACEDTRRTAKLLNACDIKKKMVAYHKHNEKEAGNRLLEAALEGADICLVSDAGCPGISDPGEMLVRLFYENGLDASVIPGPNAALSALVLSGLDTSKFVFEGFLPPTPGKRRSRLEQIKDEERTLIFYEAPHRLGRTLGDMAAILGTGRRAAAVKEITKIYETVFRGTLKELADMFSKEPSKGEFVIVVEGRDEILAEIPKTDIKEKYREILEATGDRKKALLETARLYNLTRREAYSKINIEG